MRINLRCKQDIRHGYTNIDIFPPGQLSSDLYKQGDISNLDWLVENNTVEEILAMDCIEYIPTSCVKPTLINWAQKLAKGGTLKILVPDCYSIAKSFYQGQFNLEEFSKMLLGTEQESDIRKSIIDEITLSQILNDIGLTITLKRYEGVAIYIEAIR